MITLSKRMERVASMVTEGSRVADIGTDHGYVPISLVERGKVSKAIAMDVRKGPLSKAMEHIKESGLEEKIQTRLSDGMEQLKEGEVDSVIIAGMGGELIVKILRNASHILPSIKELILQPQSEIYKVREELHRLGFCIEKESMLLDEGKYYTVIKAIKGQEHYENQWEYLYGKKLLLEKNEILHQWLLKEYRVNEALCKKLEGVSSEAGMARREELLHKQSMLKGGLAFYDNERIG